FERDDFARGTERAHAHGRERQHQRGACGGVGNNQLNVRRKTCFHRRTRGIVTRRDDTCDERGAKQSRPTSISHRMHHGLGTSITIVPPELPPPPPPPIAAAPPITPTPTTAHTHFGMGRRPLAAG